MSIMNFKGDIMVKCWSDKVVSKLPSIPIVLFDKDSDGSYKRIAIVESINEDGTITVIESNNTFKR